MRKKVPQKTKMLLFYIIAMFSATFSFAQNEGKIAPAFRYLLEHRNDTSEEFRSKIPTQYLLIPKEGFATKDAQLEKRYDCIVYTKNAQALKEKQIVINSLLPTFVTAWVTLEQIEEMANMADVAYIKNPEIDGLHNDVAVATSGASLLHAGKLNNTIYKGNGVIVAIYDTGIDWKHLDFRNPSDPTKSRILRIWDQTITATFGGEAPPAGFSYGVEYNQIQINNEIDGTPAGFVRENDVNGHGTHVSGTAAGNGAAIAGGKYTGMAPEADIIFIKGGNNSFPQSNTVDALTYLKNLATVLGRPIVLNMSIGGQSGPHDGTRPHELAVDDFTSSGTGRAVVISAGNDNGTNIHNKFTLSVGDNSSTSFSVPTGSTGSDVFRYTVYGNTNGTVATTVLAPDGSSVTSSGPIMAGACNVTITNIVDAANGQRSVDFFITRTSGSPTGTWIFTVTNTSASSMVFDGWLNYRNNAYANTSLIGGDNQSLVGSPGNATSAITVASYVARNTWPSPPSSNFSYSSGASQDDISTFSALGPRRDGVQKPEIAAHGQAVISCLSSSTTPTASDVVETGLYQKNQGTSMAAPVTTGAIALLLQANPTATATQIKSFITSTANKDNITEAPGATPNTTWGYGKLDVFKAASSMFNCNPSNRKTYLYDFQGLSSFNTGTTFTTSRVAVRFTPDITGKLAGVYFHTHNTTVTSLVVEVRANSGGIPGTLLGTINVPDSKITRYTWNYIDFSNLNIGVTNSTDYFAVVYRDPTSSASWSLRGENISLDNRSLTSNDGISWANPNIDYKIRSVVYNNAQFTTGLPTINVADTRNINTTNQFINNNCQLIAQAIPNGALPFSGNVTANVWIEASVPNVNGNPYVARHYQIVPALNTSTATSRVTLYFKQQEFTAFNSHVGSLLDLPANSSDAIGITNLRIGKFAGSSNDGSGLPATYTTGPVTIINPADSDIVWNGEKSRWEITFDVTGAGGYVAQTLATPLPIAIEYFRGNKQNGKHLLTWKASCTGNNIKFSIERSTDAINFTSINTITTNAARCGQPFDFTDVSPLVGKNYYRIKIIEDGRTYYTNIILLQTDKDGLSNLFPNAISKGEKVTVTFAGTNGNLQITDAVGRIVFNKTLVQGVQSIQPELTTAGTYFFTITNATEKTIVGQGKIVVR